MNIDSLNKWLTLGANLGVLIGIFVVVVEISQNTRTQKLSSVQAVLGMSAEINISTASNPAFIDAVIAMNNQEELTPAQISVIDSTLMAIFAAHWQIFQLRQENSITDDLWYAYERRNIENVNNPYFKKWWDENKYKFGDSFREYLDNLSAS